MGVIRRADPADLAAIAEVFRAASPANDDGVAETQFGPAPRMRLSVRGA
jgi:hypothetical protein